MRIPFAIVLLVVGLPLAAADCTVDSGASTGLLVELYTSEGCDSCPPADRWLSAIGAARSIVPMGFHVDYWDSLGWKDTFGDARFSERQRQIARIAGARAVYTPQVIVAGRDFTGWRDPRSFEGAVRRAESKPARASMRIDVRGGAARVSAQAQPGARTDDLALHVALTQNSLVTQVRAGENRGATLRHDFVVREFHSSSQWKGRSIAIDLPLERFPSASVAAFVQDRATGEVLQALRASCPLKEAARSRPSLPSHPHLDATQIHGTCSEVP